mmetsp:Transcript_40051/g.96351  ORF Transcript_40051/g.96351 Transcript_40051/m.96351 type:complete len:287 (-) Transcript_40051:78-938(-)
MPSRKRNKGKKLRKERTASSSANPLLFPQTWQHGKPSGESTSYDGPPYPKLFWSGSWELEKDQGNGDTLCQHPGQHSIDLCVANNPNCYMLKVGLDMLVSQKLSGGTVLLEALLQALLIATSACPGNMDDDGFRESLKSLYLAAGTNSVLHWAASHLDQMYVYYCTGVITYLECYEILDPKARFIELKMKLDDVVGGGERAATLFFSKRISCSCLDEKVQLVKNHPKTSICCVCNEKKNCKVLHRCGACKVVQYCSEECQKADWPVHKDHCKMFHSCMKKCKESRV